MQKPEPKSGPDSDQKSVTEIASGMYQIRVPLDQGHAFSLSYVNSYLIKGTAGWLLIDTGWYRPESFTALENSLHSLKLGFADIKTIVLTHSHPDHYGMAGKIKLHSSGLKILCHRWEADLIESRYIQATQSSADMVALLRNHDVPEQELAQLASVSMPVLQMVINVLPDKVLYGGEIISTGLHNLEVIWTPGHSPGHICLYEAESQLLFCGDHILPTITPNVGYHTLSGDNPLGDYLSALRKLENIQVSRVHPGHEYSFADIKSRINAITEHHRLRQGNILNLIQQGFSTSYQIARHLVWSLPLSWDEFAFLQKRAAITETIAILEYMRWEGRVRHTVKNNQVHYSIE